MSHISADSGNNFKVSSLLKLSPAKTEKLPVKAEETPKPVSTSSDSMKLAAVTKQPKAETSLSFVSDVPLTNIDAKEVFHNSNFATAADLDKILKRYGSPHQGKGKVMLDICKKYDVNPVMMLAIMQKESSFGNRNNNPRLNDENIANPWSVHFNEPAKGIKKLRLKDGSMPTFEQSLEAAARTMINLAGDSSTPLTQAGKRYSVSGDWTPSVKSMYTNMIKNILKIG